MTERYWPRLAAHGVSFNSHHTWRDWGMLPQDGVPIVSPPPPKLNLLDAPLVDGVIDQTLIPMGKIYYGVREGSWTFQQVDKSRDWPTLYAEVLTVLNGGLCAVILDDDPYWVYTGHAWVDQVTSSGILATIVINCKLQPYKAQSYYLDEEWNFDDIIESNLNFAPLAFEVGSSDSDHVSLIVYDEKVPRTIVNPTGQTLTMSSATSAPIRMTVDASTTIYFDGNTYDATSSSVPTIQLPPGKNVLWFDSADANVTVSYNLPEVL